MFRRQTLWLTGLAVVLCGALAWRSFQGQEAADRAAVALGAPPAKVTLARAPADDPKAEKESTTTKRKKKVSSQRDDEVVQYNKLTPKEVRVILHKGTEPPNIGEYTNLKDPGTYICRRCNAPLYHSDTKFESHCGWPSFDDEIKGAVTRRRETDGTGRIEIVCSNCGGHLGHVFMGEGFTPKNTRHCVNSVSMRFIAQGKPLPEVIKPKSKKAKEDKDAEKAVQSEEAPAEKNESSSKADATKPGA